MNDVVYDGSDISLSCAVETGNLDLVEFLVANGADVNRGVPRMVYGTVLHQACEV